MRLSTVSGSWECEPEAVLRQHTTHDWNTLKTTAWSCHPAVAPRLPPVACCELLRLDTNRVQATGSRRQAACRNEIISSVTGIVNSLHCMPRHRAKMKTSAVGAGQPNGIESTRPRPSLQLLHQLRLQTHYQSYALYARTWHQLLMTFSCATQKPKKKEKKL